MTTERKYKVAYVRGRQQWKRIIYIPTGKGYQEGGLWDTQEEAEWVAQNLEWDQWIDGWRVNEQGC